MSELVKISSLEVGEWFKDPEGVLVQRVVNKTDDGVTVTSGGLSMGFAPNDHLVIPLPDFS